MNTSVLSGDPPDQPPSAFFRSETSKMTSHLINQPGWLQFFRRLLKDSLVAFSLIPGNSCFHLSVTLSVCSPLFLVWPKFYSWFLRTFFLHQLVWMFCGKCDVEFFDEHAGEVFLWWFSHEGPMKHIRLPDLSGVLLQPIEEVLTRFSINPTSSSLSLMLKVKWNYTMYVSWEEVEVSERTHADTGKLHR